MADRTILQMKIVSVRPIENNKTLLLGLFGLHDDLYIEVRAEVIDSNEGKRSQRFRDLMQRMAKDAGVASIQDLKGQTLHWVV